LWIKFFQENNLKSPQAIVMVLLLATNGLYYALSIFEDIRLRQSGLLTESMITSYLLLSNVIVLFFSALFIVAITILMQFILKQAELYEATNEEKVRAERFKAELITNMSHDMKTPLTSLINYVDLLSKLPIDNPQFKDYTSILERKSLRLKHLIFDLLEASKVGTGNVQLHMEQLNFSELIGQTVGEFEDDYISKNLKLVLRKSDQATIINADGEQLYRIIENLLNNTLKYSLENTRVFCELTTSNQQAVLKISNTSKIPLEKISEDLTQQFIRGDKSRQTEGSGLGLYIAKNLAELMNGTLEININGDLFEATLIFKQIETPNK
ncbi:MAG: HAMP domain-containing histidine kinase, partial [Lactococcus lactis]|nr:HAMP domain-containing histidine kinase [Lactococcus lactis]